MLKIISVIAVLIVSSALGFLKANTYKLRQKQLEETISFIDLLKIYLLERNMKVKEAFLSLSDVEILSELSFIKTIKEDMKTERDFKKVYLYSFENSTMKLKDDDIAILKSLINVIGMSEKSQQNVELLSIKSMLLKNLEDAKEQSEKNVALCQKLGVLCGIAISVMII